MSSSRQLRSFSGSLSTMTTTTQYFMSDVVVPIEASSTLDFDMNLTGVVGNFVAKPCVALIEVRPDDPDAPAAITDGSFTGSAGHTHFRESVSGGSYAMARLGIAFKLSSGSALGSAQFAISPAVHDGIEMLGSREIFIHPGMVTSTDLNYAEISRWTSAVGTSKIKGWMTVNENLSDYLEYQLIVRSATDIRAPNTWQTAEASATNPSTTNSERNTGEITPPGGASLDSNLLFQLGIAFRKKTGAGGNPRAIIRASSMVIRG